MSYIGIPSVTELPELESVRRLREGGPGSGPQGERNKRRLDLIKSRQAELRKALKDAASKPGAPKDLINEVHSSLKKASNAIKRGDRNGAARQHDNAYFDLRRMGWKPTFFRNIF